VAGGRGMDAGTGARTEGKEDTLSHGGVVLKQQT